MALVRPTPEIRGLRPKKNTMPDTNASGAQVPCISLLADLRSRLWARCENAYCDMIAVARRDESLGWEIKVERGEFGRKELDSHTKMGELLGRHRALAEACREIDEVLKANAKAQRPAVAGTLPPLVGLSDGGEA